MKKEKLTVSPINFSENGIFVFLLIIAHLPINADQNFSIDPYGQAAFLRLQNIFLV